MPAVVRSDSMDPLTRMPITSGIAVEEGGQGKPLETPTVISSLERRALPTSWTRLSMEGLLEIPLSESWWQLSLKQ